MVPMVRHSTIGGLPLPELPWPQGFLSQEPIWTPSSSAPASGGGEIVALLEDRLGLLRPG